MGHTDNVIQYPEGGFSTTHCKMQAYAQQATDPGVKQFFQKSAQSAMESKQQLMQFLQ